jgi:ubiquinone/menaquinone biosynthesis C-methylase UbiE
MSTVFGQWAQSYAREPNALLQLGDRALASALGDPRGLRILDAGCGPGRWMRRAAEGGARAAGLDAEPAMLRQAPPGAVALGDLERPPFRDAGFDLVLAAFSLSYPAEPAEALTQLCRLIRGGGRLIVVDLHPDAVEAGWKRTFTTEHGAVEVPSRVLELDAALLAPPSGWRVTALDSLRFGEPERPLFGDEHWARVKDAWAVRLAVWRRQP